MHIADMARWLAPSKVAFVASAHLLDSVAAINLNTEQQMLMNEIPDQILRETVHDYCVNQQFRRDLWTKGVRTINAA